MYGSPDDGSVISRPDTPSHSETISDSDVVRDAKHVHWHPLTVIPDTAGSLRSSVDQDAFAAQPNKRFRGVRARIKAVARFLSNSKEQDQSATVQPPSDTSDSEDTAQTSSTHVVNELPAEHQARSPRMKASEVTAEANQRDAVAVLEAIRERLDPEGSSTSTLHPLPPLPQLPRPPTPVLVPPVAMSPKKRHANGFEDALGKGRPDFAHMQAGVSRPAVPPPIRSVSRPLPPTPVHAPIPRFGKVDNFHSKPLPASAFGLGLLQDKNRVDQFARAAAEIHTHGDSTNADKPRAYRVNHQVDAHRLADELESLVSSSARRRKPQSDFSSDTTRLADSSREAQCGWRPNASPGFPRHETFGQVHAHASSAATSMFANESEPEAIKRIQTWRVQITNPPSVLGSQCASAHSGLYTDGGLSSHLTSISRSPLSKDNKPRSQVDDAQKTPVLKSRALPNGRHRLAEESRHNKEGRSHRESRERDAKTNTNGCHVIGTRHIARLTDSQFERLARATEALRTQACMSPEASSILDDVPESDKPAPHLGIGEEGELRSSVDAARTTLSVLEERASPHIETLDAMIRRHPDKMYKLFQKRPGLMLVFLLRCKIEDRLSHVPSLVNAEPASNAGTTEKDIDLLEGSLIDLHFDADPVKHPAPRQSAEGDAVPSIVISHATGSSPTSTDATPQATQSPNASQRPEVRAGSDKTLHEIVCRLEKAGELCIMQHALVSIQNRLINTTDTCTQLSDRLSKLEQAVFSPPSVSHTPSTSFSMQV
ncbi:hypothetical protein PANT_7c00144 [Moesziomyces antarcticus T-34]|uniref:Uncharacterized protein n=1 Tax=Pseudozyma antarctica (strain T-34) TaxID=1151754 RepID=M9LU35_PSEA3|nr:hypothetical protein PANT_7c00144 [Moesziomyces antarcticus T-34]